MKSLNRILPYLVSCISIIIWGATPAITQIAVAKIDPATVGILRTVIAAIILLPVALIIRLPRPKNKEGLINLIVISLAGFVGYTLFFTIGIKMTSTSHAALILAATPIFTGFFGFVIDKKWPKIIWWLGVIIAMIGESILIGYRFSNAVEGIASIKGDLLVLISIILAGAGHSAGGHLSSNIGTRAATAWGISMGGIVLFPVLLSRLFISPNFIVKADITSWAAVLYLAIFTSIIAYVTWYWALDKGGVARIAPMQFVQPIISLIIAVSFLNETLNMPIIIALIIIIFGMFIIQWSTVEKI